MGDRWLADPRWRLTWCRGPDAVSFLQGLLSADLSGPPGTAVRSFLLHPQGKVLAVLRVLVGAEEVGIITDEPAADAVVAALSRYRIRVRAEFEPDERPLRLALDEAAEVPGAWSVEDGVLRADALLRGASATLLADVAAPGATMGSEEWERWRILHGEPVTGIDVDDSTIPQETGLVRESVSFTKGCYLGQELVARIDSRGRVNQRLVVVRSASPFAPGDVLEGEGRAAPVTSAARDGDEWIGLATVRHEIVDGARVLLHTAAGDVAAEVGAP